MSTDYTTLFLNELIKGSDQTFNLGYENGRLIMTTKYGGYEFVNERLTVEELARATAFITGAMIAKQNRFEVDDK